MTTIKKKTEDKASIVLDRKKIGRRIKYLERKITKITAEERKFWSKSLEYCSIIKKLEGEQALNEKLLQFIDENESISKNTKSTNTQNKTQKPRGRKKAA